MRQIGVRDLRQHTSRYLKRVQAGEAFEVTDNGRPVARLVPVPADPWQALIDSGQVIAAELPGGLLDADLTRDPELIAGLRERGVRVLTVQHFLETLQAQGTEGA